MASISANGSKGHHKYTLEVVENSTSVQDNTSSLSFTFKISSLGGGYDWYGWGSNISFSININGSVYTGTIPDYDGSSTVTLKSGSLTVKHNDDGKKSISISFSVTDGTGQYYTSGNASSSGTMTLSTIPRYLTINNFSISSITETSVVVNWSVSDPRTSTYYSLDGGTSWVGSSTYGETLASDNKSGSFNIKNLNAETSYNLKVKFKRTDSQLWTESSSKSFKTYDYPYCTSTPNFTIGNAATLGFYNPLNRLLSWQVLGNDNSVIAGNSTTGTSYTGISGDGSVNNLYASIPNAKSGTYKVKVTYGSSVKTKTGGTYSIKGNETPSVGSITYADTNTSVTAITGNNQHIVQNKSNLKVTYTAGTGNKSASITKYTFTLNGVTKTSTSAGGTVDFGTINSSNDLTLTMTVTDSRGLTSSSTKKITMLEYSNPSAIVTLERLNNYEDEAYLTIDGSTSSVNSKNTMSIKYRYKVSGGNYGDFTTIGDNVKKTLSLNKENVYIFNVVVTDKFGSTYNQEHTLNKGVFPLFIDIEKNSAGVNRLPVNSNSFELNGTIYSEDMKCKNLLYTPYTETNKLTFTATRDDHSIATNFYCYLEAGKRYTFSCKTDGTFGGSSGTDTVEVFLLKDKAYDTYISINANPKSFTPTSSGYYYLRYDVNKNGITHTFWDFQIEEGNVATSCVEGKEFSNKQRYLLEEQVIGTWVKGEPIYRKVVSIPASSFGTGEATSGSSISISHNIKSIGVVIRNDAIWERSTSTPQKRMLPSNYYGNAGWDGQVYVDNQYIYFELGSLALNAIRSANYIYAILEYTKTN